jgi:hypothetical protein
MLKLKWRGFGQPLDDVGICIFMVLKTFLCNFMFTIWFVSLTLLIK